MIPVSVFIVAQDEAQNIERVLRSVKDFAQVLVIDSGSTDNTVELAKAAGATVIHQPWLGYAGQKQFALTQCTCDWVLNLDADEELTSECIGIIKDTIVQENVDALRFIRNDIFMDQLPAKWMRKGNHLRLYRRQKAHFDVNQKVHETAFVEGKEVRTDIAFTHYGYNRIDALITKNNLYSSLRAEEKFASNKRPSLIKLTLVLPLTFFQKYILQGRILNGKRGFILATIDAFYAFMKEAKLWEKHLTKP
ncbi:MAG: glycosyltransferase family 2 protein [Glaciecola sp.]|nr:glycosyltransferase family 2 protein [Glaciecola sp.]MDG1814865.1 glycosyltransferase family 2 protein [Glaciecola sp.]MDG2100454.1 glycosyltransferase family 2 protein [Glaciecola sp.]